VVGKYYFNEENCLAIAVFGAIKKIHNFKRNSNNNNILGVHLENVAMLQDKDKDNSIIHETKT